MKIVCQIICLILLVFAVSAHANENFEFPVYRHVSSYGITNTWFVTMRRLENLPAWNEQGEPPLSVSKATTLAKTWVVSKGGSTNSYVETIEFRSTDPGTPPGSSSKFRPYWFYIIQYNEVYQFGSSVTCVVLPDGSIVEPESSPSVTNILRYLD